MAIDSANRGIIDPKIWSYSIGLKKRDSQFSIGHVSAKRPFNRPKIKLDVDYKKDAEKLEFIAQSGISIEDRGLDILKQYGMLFPHL